MKARRRWRFDKHHCGALLTKFQMSHLFGNPHADSASRFIHHLTQPETWSLQIILEHSKQKVTLGTTVRQIEQAQIPSLNFMVAIAPAA